MKWWIYGSAMVGLVIWLWPLTAAAQTPDQGATALMALANDYRQTRGLLPLPGHPALIAAAEEQAGVMARAGLTTHIGLDGSSAPERAARAGFQGSVVEIICAGPHGAAEVLGLWRDSELSGSTLLNPAYTALGAATGQADNGRVYWVIVLGQPAASEGDSAEIASLSTSTLSYNLDISPPPISSPFSAPQAAIAPLATPAHKNTLPTPDATAQPVAFITLPTPRPTRAAALSAEPTATGLALAANVRGVAARLASADVAPQPTPAALAASVAVAPAPADGKFDPIPLIVGLLAIIGAGGLVYKGYQMTPTKRDPFRR